ncbi:glucose PTS transporter subunit IIA [Spiroplasma turonicum]|uniref:Beta-glucoside PTS system IIABC component n=1 Tax=Spiroplasma turonicum TaxID=216946 RepID=A0A0K1P6K4_9MOLU|nr:glucose PTS transporter subunit IIA [Spiroplasma turonicum]AKU79839.1 beta-glucoside PTS system IIABC component [Spiroplasma turonicum]ALX70855.1 PTS system, beta-glucosides-specific IIC component [Spiroplasma turonicum]
MKIKVYAPISGYIDKIENIKDPVFAEKNLGDGVFIQPTDSILCSPLNNSKIELITDTKHALYFKNDDAVVLVHIGLETVSLNGLPFKVYKKQGDILKKDEEVLRVDWDLIDKKSLDRSTPVLIDVKDFKTYKIICNKIGKNVNKGDLLYEVEFEVVESSEKINKIILDKRESKYKSLALKYLLAIGGTKNQSNCHNCMTRLRFKIINKELVDEKVIKKIELTKGINWNGEELQIIIGGEVYKVKDECQKIIDRPNDELVEVKEIKKKVPFKQKIMGAITAIVFPTIPVLIGTGVISGIQSILVLSKVIVNPAVGQTPMDIDLFSALMYIMSKVGIELVGIVFLCSTVKYFKGDPWFAIWLGVALTSRYLFGGGWTLFTVFENPIVIKTYEGTVLPMICTGLMLVFMDRWVKKWMPTSVDIVFRPALVFLSVFIIMLFTVGPFFKIVEQLIAKFVILLGKIPFGIGMGIFAMLWQPLILTGTHVAVIAVITLPMQVGDPSAMYASCQIGIMGQIGAVIAVSIITKNKITKQAIFAALPGAIFGVTEPIVYGINLPKIKPFLYGCLGGLVGGTLAGILNVAQYRRTGLGIMSWLGFDIGWGTAFGIIANFVALFSALLITLVFYKDRKLEYIGIRDNNKKLYKIISKNFNLKESETKELKNKLINYYLEVKKVNSIYKNYEKNIITLQKLELRKQSIINKLEITKDKIYIKALKYEDKNLAKYNSFAKIYNDLKLDDKYDLLVKKIEEQNIIVNNNQNEVNNFNDKLINLYNRLIDSYNKKQNKILSNFSNNIWNSLNSINISYQILDYKEINYSNKEFINLKTKEELKNEKKISR